MPELPEVETTRRTIAPHTEGRVILAIEHSQPQKYPNTELAHGLTIGRLQRRGKYLIFPLHRKNSNASHEKPDHEKTDHEKTDREKADRELVVHLGMTGSFRLEEGPHTRLIFRLQHNHEQTALYFNDPRRFGKVRVVQAGDYSAMPTLAQMGPEPLGADFLAQFVKAAAKAGKVKPWLLSQKPVAGVGNIYADEALWRAQLHPAATRLEAKEATRLYHAVREVMAEAVELGGSSLGNGAGNYRQPSGDWGGFQLQHAVYGRGGQPCLRCGTPIKKVVLGQRGTHFCPQCQVL